MTSLPPPTTPGSPSLKLSWRLCRPKLALPRQKRNPREQSIEISKKELLMPAREYQQENTFGSTTELLDSPHESAERPGHSANLPSPKDGDSDKFTQYEFIDRPKLSRRLTVPASWIRDQVRGRSEDPLPHVNLGKYVRFLWGSPALELWIRRRIVVGNNRRVGRPRRKEQK